MKARLLTLCVYALALFGTIGLSGCDKRLKDSGQVLARVNGDEISVHQVNFALQYARQRNTAPNASEAVLETMISRQLAVQEAISLGLDRNPDVMMRLQEARLETLASAYAAEVARKLPPIRDEDVASFYRSNLLFLRKDGSTAYVESQCQQRVRLTKSSRTNWPNHPQAARPWHGCASKLAS